MGRVYSDPPWFIERIPNEECPFAICRTDEDGVKHDIALIPDYPSTNPSDLRLISMAPELADAIDELLPWISGMLDILQDVGVRLQVEDYSNLDRLIKLRNQYTEEIPACDPD